MSNIKKVLDKIVEELVSRLEDLQIEEKAGKKVFDQAEKAVKTTEKKLKDQAGITGTEVRKAVQKTTGSGQLLGQPHDVSRHRAGPRRVRRVWQQRRAVGLA